MHNIIEEIERLRKEQKMSITEICQKSEISRRSYHFMIKGRGYRMETAHRLLGALGYEICIKVKAKEEADADSENV